MNIYDIWPSFVILAVLLFVFSFSPLFKFVDEPTGKGRMPTLDGLRGFLALSVFIHHGVITYAYIKDGAWTYPPSRFYALLGQVGVAYFFMISGFLFWAKLLREQKRINWTALYIGRVFRIAPVYLVAIFSMFLIVFLRTGFELHQPPAKLAGAMGKWLGLGLLGKPDINGYKHTTLILAGVTWSLYFEWLYYFSLRLTHFFAIRKTRMLFVLCGFGISLALTFFLHGAGITYISLFFAGMTAATLIDEGVMPKIDPSLGALAVIACLTLLLQCFDEIHNGFCIALLMSSFYIICLGNSLFGLLTSTAAQRLGHISYGIYLMQGIVLTVVYWSGTMRKFAFSNDGYYWLTLMLCGLVLSTGSAVLYAFVERPGIALGRKVAAALARVPVKPANSPPRRFSPRG